MRLMAGSRLDWLPMLTAFAAAGLLTLRIARRRAAVLDAASASESMREILESAGPAVVAIGHNRSITYMNPAAERMLGYSAEEMVGKQTPAIIHLEPEVVARG